MADEKMYVLKRNNQEQEINYDKVLERLKKLAKKLKLEVNCGQICMKIMEQTHDKIPSEKIDELCAEQCVSLSTVHYDYNKLASAICVSNYHKRTAGKIIKVFTALYNFKDSNNIHSPVISKNIYNIVKVNHDVI